MRVVFVSNLFFLGHVIGRHGFAVDQTKVAAVRDWPNLWRGGIYRYMHPLSMLHT